MQEQDLHCLVVADNHRWQALYFERLQEGTRILAQLGCMLPAEEVHCWLAQHNHRPLLQGGNPQQQQKDSQLEGNHHQGHGELLVLLLLEEHHLVALVEWWLMGELALVLEVLKVEDPNKSAAILN